MDDLNFFMQEPEEVTSFIRKNLTEYNEEKTGYKTQKFSFHLKNQNHIICAGRGTIFGSEMTLAELVVKKGLRKQGIGRSVLNKIEEMAIQKECVTLTISTFAFQAPEFYENNGYLKFGEIENYRNKHSLIFYRKEL